MMELLDVIGACLAGISVGSLWGIMYRKMKRLKEETAMMREYISTVQEGVILLMQERKENQEFLTTIQDGVISAQDGLISVTKNVLELQENLISVQDTVEHFLLEPTDLFVGSFVTKDSDSRQIQEEEE